MKESVKQNVLNFLREIKTIDLRKSQPDIKFARQELFSATGRWWDERRPDEKLRELALGLPDNSEDAINMFLIARTNDGIYSVNSEKLIHIYGKMNRENLRYLQPQLDLIEQPKYDFMRTWPLMEKDYMPKHRMKFSGEQIDVINKLNDENSTFNLEEFIIASGIVRQVANPLNIVSVIEPTVHKKKTSRVNAMPALPAEIDKK